ncbi:MAG: class I SAM-dependent methyltransferase [Bacillota bacterium]
MDVKTLYTDIFDEARRLNRTNASKVEFMTTMHVLKDYLEKGMRILEVGAGTGAYSLELAREGYDVTALELVPKNLEILKRHVTAGMTIHPVLGNALDLSAFEDECFDIVLNLGPLYHLPDERDRIKAIEESMRVLKKGGKAFFAYINNDMTFVTESLSYTPEFLLGDPKKYYDPETFKVVDDPFTVLRIEEVRTLMQRLNLKEIRHVATDGFAELLKEKINALDEAKFKEWFRFHLYACEKPEMLGASHHLLYVTEKPD